MDAVGLDLSIIFALLTALGLGLGHSLDPDHVVAVSTLVCNNKSIRKSVVSAVVWGLGHSISILIVGFVVLALRVAIPENIVNVFEAAAGIMLILLGAFVLRPLIIKRAFKSNETDVDTHTHSHEGHIHTHPHAHENGHSHSHLHKSALTGAIQGLGGSAAIMLVALTTMPSMEIGLVFILLFGVGVISGMVCISCLIGSVIAYTANNFTKVHEIIKAITGTLSVAIGLIIIISLLL